MNVQSSKLKQKNFDLVDQIKNRLIWCCKSTNLHGFFYVVNKTISMFARFLFAFMSCCSLILCSYLIFLQLYEYKDQFVVTTILSTAYPVWKFRFPSVTVCNFNVVYKDNLRNLKNLIISQGIPEETFDNFVRNLSSLTLPYRHFANVDDFKKVHSVLEQNGYNVDEMMAELAQPCNKMLKQCFWRAVEVPCSQIIQRVKTNHGYCCSFNYYGTRKISDQIIDPLNVNSTYMGLVGSNYGLHLVLDVEKDQYVSSLKPAYGFSVTVQEGADFHNMHLSAKTMHAAEEMKITVMPSIYVSSENLRDMRPEQRKCFFEDEGSLEWSSIYSYKTCLNECRAKAVFKFCNCTPFYYPAESFTRICTLADVSCIIMNKRKYATLRLARGFRITEDDGDGDYEEYNQCCCSPQCNERIFNIHANKAKVTTMFEYGSSNLSVLKVYYSGESCVKSQRDIYYTWNRILASVGGIFSLCLGGSVISIVECFYIFGKCIFDYNNVKQEEKEEEEIPQPDKTFKNTSVAHHREYNVQKKLVPGSRAQIFVKAFGNQQTESTKY